MNHQSDEDAPLSQQEHEWVLLYERVAGYLRSLGTESPIGEGDYWLLDENWGQHLIRVEVQNLNLLVPPVVKGLQRLLSDYPDWEIAMAVDVPGTETRWPDSTRISHAASTDVGRMRGAPVPMIVRTNGKSFKLFRFVF